MACDPAEAAVARLVIIVVAEVQIYLPLSDNWEPGPLRMKWRVGTPKEVTSDIRGRTYYLNENLESCLYIRDRDIIRWSRRLDVHLPDAAPAKFIAAEILRLPDLTEGNPGARGLAAIHIKASNITAEQAARTIYGVTNLNHRHGEAMRQAIERLLDGAAALTANSRRVPAVSFLAPVSELPKIYEASRFADTTPIQQWLNLLDSQARVPPAPEALLSAASQDIQVSDDYTGRVTRFGITLVARKSEADLTNLAVHDSIEFFARGLYTDLLLFGTSQRALLANLSSQSTLALEKAATVADVSRIRTAMLWYRRRYLRSDFAPQPPYDNMLRLLGEAVDIDRSMERVQHDLDDLASRLQAELTQQTNAILGLIALVGLPVGVAVSIWQNVTIDNVLGLIITLSTATVISVALLLTTRARNLIRDLKTGRRSNDTS